MYPALRAQFEKVILLSDDEFEAIVPYFRHRSFKKNDHIFSAGDAVPDNYYILSGLTKLVYTDPETIKEHILSFAMEDWWDNDFQAYYTRSKATLAMVCLEDTEVLCLSLDDLQALRQLPKMEHFLLERSINSMLSAQRRILSLMTSSAQERYEQLMRLYPALLQRVPKTQLAAYLGVSRETLSRM
ncbi:Crp/Fnr family transcriptional regulator [Mucilaginibacter myungsuensis]|uniref:Crp/Fnr family transcriptional regulator n=2 Tax=Mucilaginibacter myungsuensis TaxID=649104 RepID=A0A929PWK3_9SPHI|nr:Crp/Fnr family transcriptional regulator [Mucilaginibacter myungsuensis]